MYEAIKKEIYGFHSLSELSKDELYRLINSVLLRQKGSKKLSADEKNKLIEKVYSSIRGYGVLDELLRDDSVSEIMVNRYDCIFVERSGELELTELVFESEKELFDTIQRIVGRSGREVNAASPVADVHLSGGERVNIVLPPISLEGPVLTIRRFPKAEISIQDLVRYGTVTKEAADFLKELVRCKYNIFISGGTSSGKTTFLNVLSGFIPENERIVTIEDSAELRISGIKNLIRLEVRNANAAGSGRVTMKDLIRTSLRMRPDRIIVGEVRGEEVIDMLNAMNTGHDGSLSTGHANSSYDMLYRLETMVLQSGVTFPLCAIRQHIASSIDIIVHLCREANGKRVVSEISEVQGMADGEIILQTLFRRENGELVSVGNKFIHNEKFQIYGGSYEEII